MAHITLADAQGWADGVKLKINQLDVSLESQVVTEVFATIGVTYDVTTWLDEASTPKLVKQIVSMLYIGWLFQRTYSEDDDISTYGMLLMDRANTLMEGISNGTVILPETGVVPGNLSGASFYPNDLSTASSPSYDDSSLGGPAFSMGFRF